MITGVGVLLATGLVVAVARNEADAVLPEPRPAAVGTAGDRVEAHEDDDRYAAALSTPVEDPYYPSKGDPRFDALHYALKLRWTPARDRLIGTAAIDFRAAARTDTLVLDLSRHLATRRVRLDGEEVTTSRAGHHLTVRTDAPLRADSRHRLVIRYAGTPRPVHAAFTRSDLATLGWEDRRSGAAWAMQEPFGAFTWYPVNDHPSDKAFYDTRISVPRRLVGVFNGRLVERHQAGVRTVTRWHLADPAASYLVTIGIGDYVQSADTGPHGVPISYWLPRDHTAKELRVAQVLPSAMRWLERRLGRYPFDRAGILATPGGSGMETQTLISLNRSLLQHGARNVVVHELAHHWYGDTVTPRTWKDLWLNEGWAMYAQIRWEAHTGQRSMRSWRRNLVAADQSLRDQAGPPGTYDPRRFADGNVYYCAALMIDQLRATIGHEAFRDLWRAWPQQHRNSNADREDYITWASERIGRDLEPFFTRWLDSPDTPRLVRR